MISVLPGQEVDDVLFRLIANPTIRGRVLDENGNPLQGIEVQALVASRSEQAPDASRRELVPLKVVATNHAGEYRLLGLPAAEYYLSATDPRKRSSSEQNTHAQGVRDESADASQKAYPPIYYPNTSDRDEAAALVLSAGQEIRIDFRLQSVNGFSILGRILSHNRQPAANAVVYLEPRERDLIFTSLRYSERTDMNGRFAFKNIVPGTYVVSSSKGQPGITYSAQQSINLTNANISNLEIILGLGRIVTGKLLVEGAPIDLKGQNVMVWLHAVDGDDMGFGAAEVQPDGNFRGMPELAEGTYRIELSGLPPDFYLKAVQSRTQDVLKEGLTISNAVAPDPLQLTVSSAGARLDGLLSRDGEPVGGTKIEIIDRRATPFEHGFFSAITNTHGNFTVRGVPPGTYEIFAYDNESDQVLQVVNLNDNRTHVGAVELVDGDRKQLELKLPATP
jgi:protocatechuate 3,4-dioxygenase beta subunit